jgi:hypothetical protein
VMRSVSLLPAAFSAVISVISLAMGFSTRVLPLCFLATAIPRICDSSPSVRYSRYELYCFLSFSTDSSRYFSAENVLMAGLSGFPAICSPDSDIRSRCSSSEGKRECWRLSASLGLFFLDRGCVSVRLAGRAVLHVALKNSSPVSGVGGVTGDAAASPVTDDPC